jgi:hypothetical protein
VSATRRSGEPAKSDGVGSIPAARMVFLGNIKVHAGLHFTFCLNASVSLSAVPTPGLPLFKAVRYGS